MIHDINALRFGRAKADDIFLDRTSLWVKGLYLLGTTIYHPLPKETSYSDKTIGNILKYSVLNNPRYSNILKKHNLTFD